MARKSHHIAIAAGLGCTSLLISPTSAFAANIAFDQVADQFVVSGGTTFLAGAAAGVVVSSLVSLYGLHAQKRAFERAQHDVTSQTLDSIRKILGNRVQQSNKSACLHSSQSDDLGILSSSFDVQDKDALGCQDCVLQETIESKDSLKTKNLLNDSNVKSHVDDTNSYVVSVSNQPDSVINTAVNLNEDALDALLDDVMAEAQSKARQHSSKKDSLVEEIHQFGKSHSLFDTKEKHGVPVITRAKPVDGVDAWGNFDNDTFGDNLEVSCDPYASKDLHELAFENLKQEAKNAQTKCTPAQSSNQMTENIAAANESTFFDNVSDRNDSFTGDDQSSASVPVHDYSANKEMWAQALSVLDEDESIVDEKSQSFSLPVTSVSKQPTSKIPAMQASIPIQPQTPVMVSPAMSGVVMAQPVMYVPACSTVAVPVSYQTAAIPFDTMKQMSINNHVDQLIQEEFSKAHSANVRKVSRDYLHIVEGGNKTIPYRQNRNA